MIIYVWCMYEKKTHQFPLVIYWCLATLSPRLIVGSTQISRVNSTFTSSEKWRLGISGVRWPFVSDNQHTTEPASKKKTLYFRLSPRNSPYLGMVEKHVSTIHTPQLSLGFSRWTLQSWMLRIFVHSHSSQSWWVSSRLIPGSRGIAARKWQKLRWIFVASDRLTTIEVVISSTKMYSNPSYRQVWHCEIHLLTVFLNIICQQVRF